MKLHRCTSLVLTLALLASTDVLAATQLEPALEIAGRDARGVPTLVKGRLGTVAESGREAGGLAFLDGFARTHLGARGAEGFTLRWVRDGSFGLTHIRVRQTIQGIPVIGAGLTAHLDQRSGEVSAVSGRFVPDPGVSAEPGLSAKLAVSLALADAGIVASDAAGEPELVFVVDRESGEPVLAWMTTVRYVEDGQEEIDRIYADAAEGTLLRRQPRIHRALNRETYDAGNTETVPANPSMVEGDLTGRDFETEETHRNVGLTYGYYLAAHGRDSIDGAGMTLESVVHWGVDDNQAYWDTEDEQMRFGDGDGELYDPLGVCLDIVAHEYTHGVTQYTSELGYQDEAGALNESLSDIFAAATEAWALGADAEPWLAGEGCRTPDEEGDALRYMHHPTLDGVSRDHYDERYQGPIDNGGIHLNSGISNLAFVLLSDGGYHPRGLEPHQVYGIGMDDAAEIFYIAQTTSLDGEDTTFEDAANLTVLAAEQRFGAGSNQAVQTRRAWCAVGIDHADCPMKLQASSTVFLGRFIVSLQWQFSGPGSVDVFRSGTVISTQSNSGSAADFVPLSQEGTYNYWVCEAGSTPLWDPNTCSNIVTVTLEF